MPTDEPEFQVALSFAGEQRDYVRQVASELAKRGVKTFYDEQEAVALWGKDQYEELQRIYKRDSNYVVMFISSDYAAKAWPTHERRSAFQGLIEQRRDLILPVRVDDTEVPGLNTNTAYLRASDFTAKGLADAVCAVIIARGGRIEPAVPAFLPGPPSDGTQDVCVVQVSSGTSAPMEGAQVVFVARNSTTTTARTDADGQVNLPVPVRRQVDVMVAHKTTAAAYFRAHDNHQNLAVTLHDGEGRASVVFDSSTGYLPGFQPRLSPIGDNLDEDGIPARMYLYVANGSVNGSAEQPYHFSVGAPMILEDHEGEQVRATCVGFVGHSSLWEYELRGP